MTTRGKLEFALLGPLAVAVDGEDRPVGGRRQQALLLRLLVSANEVVPAAVLVEDLWEEAPPARASATLQTYVSRLRQVLGPERVRGEHGGYALEVRDGELDAAVFADEVGRGRRALAAGEPARAWDVLGRALARWRGAPLTDVAGAAWALGEVTRLEELRARCYELLADAGLTLGWHHEVVGVAEEAVGRVPLREHLWAQLMLALYRDGRQAEALRAYRRLREALAELGIEPSRELRDLEEAVLQQRPELDGPPPAPAPSAPGVVSPSPPPPPPEAAIAAPPPAVGRPVVALPALAGRARSGHLVGRDGALGRLRSAWAASADGTPRVAAVTGEAGIGKTRLVAELGGQVHEGGGVVLWGGCQEDALSPYQPVTEMLSSLFEHLPDAPLRTLLGADGAELVRLAPGLCERLPDLVAPVITDPEEDRGRLVDALVRLLGRVGGWGPILMVVDDVQHAGSDTLGVLRHVLRRQSRSGLLMVVTARDGDQGAGATDDLRDRLAGEAPVEAVHLEGLAPGDLALLAGSGAVAADELWARTGGNPFFCLQVVRHLGEQGAGGSAPGGVPAEVGDVVRRRVDALGPSSRSVLQVAALTGTEFDLDLVDRVQATGSEPVDTLDLLERAVAARLLDEVVGRPGHFRFVHALVPEALAEGMSAARRAMVHRRIGEVLAGRGSPATVVARHVALGVSEPTVGAAVTWLARAAGEQVAALAFDDAAATLHHGLDLVDLWAPHDSRATAGLHLRLAFLLGVRGEAAGQKRHAASAAEAARAARHTGFLADAAVERATWTEAGVADPTAVALIDEGLRLVGDDDPIRRATLLAVRAMHLGLAEGRILQMGAQAAEAEDVARRVGDPFLLFEVLHFRAVLLQGSPDLVTQRRIVAEMEAIESSRDVDRASPASHWGRMKSLLGVDEPLGWWDHTGLLRFRAVLALQAGDLRSFDRHVADASRSWGGASQAMGATLAMWRSLRALLDGHFEEAAEHADVMLEVAGADRNFANCWAALHFQVARELGRVEQLQPLLEAAIADAPTLPGFRTALALVRLDLGDPDGARSALGAVADDLDALSGSVAASATLAQLAEVAGALGDRALAARLYEALAPYGGQLIVVTWGVFVLGAADRYLGVLAATLGDDAEADARFAAAARLEEGAGAGPLVVRTRLCWARALLERGEDDADRAAARLLDGVRGPAAATGMALVAGEALDLLARVAPAEAEPA